MLTPASKGWGPEPSAAPPAPILPSCWAPRRGPSSWWGTGRRYDWRAGQRPPQSSSFHFSDVSLGTCGQSCFRSGPALCRLEGRKFPSPRRRPGVLENRPDPAYCPQSDSESPVLPLTSVSALSPGFPSTSLASKSCKFYLLGIS